MRRSSLQHFFASSKFEDDKFAEMCQLVAVHASSSAKYTFRGVGLDERDVSWLQEVVDEGGYLKDIRSQGVRAVWLGSR